MMPTLAVLSHKLTRLIREMLGADDISNQQHCFDSRSRNVLSVAVTAASSVYI